MSHVLPWEKSTPAGQPLAPQVTWQLIVQMPAGPDLLLEERAVETKGDLMEDIYGVKIRMEQV